LDKRGTLFKEKMIPVRILVTKKEVKKIVKFTINHYDQDVVLAYKLSSDYILMSKEDGL